MKTDTYNVNNNPPGSPHEGRRAPHAQPTSALRAHTPCWLAMAWSFLNCSSTFSTIFIRAASRRYSSAVCLLELMSLRCSSVRASGRLPHLRPRSGRKKSKDGQEAHSKLKKEVKKGSGSVRMARSIIPAMPRATGLSCGNARNGHGTRRVAAVSQQLACCGRIPAHGCSCRLRAGRCCCHRRCGHQGREREPIRGYQISPGFGLAGLALQAELRGSPNRAFPKCTIHGTCINPIGAAPECILSKLGGCTPREVWFLNGW